MANELKHVSVGTEITQAEYEGTAGHVFNSQATGDIMYASSSSQLTRLGIGSTGAVLTVTGGVPVWDTTWSPAGDITVADTVDLLFGTGADAGFRWSTGDADNHSLVLGLDNTGQQFHITDQGAIATDWNRSAGTHPEVSIHSNTTPATDYLAIGNHDGTTASIDVVGGTTLSLDIAGNTELTVNASGLNFPANSDIIFGGTTGTNDITLTDSLADALSITRGGTDMVVFNSSTPSITFTPVTTFTGAITASGGVAGDLTGDVTGTADTATVATGVTASANNSTDETVYPTFVDGATGTQGIETDTGLTYNPSTGVLTSTTFTGALSGNATTSTEATNITTSANNSTDETVYPTFVDGATGTQGIETDTGLTYNPSSGILTSTNFTGALTGNADTATVATTVTITDNESTSETNAVIFTAGGDVDGGNLGLESDGDFTYNPSSGTVAATAFTGALTGNVTGNASGTAATVTTAAQSNITSLGTLTTLTVDNVIVNGTTIGHTSDTDLLTLTSANLAVAGDIEVSGSVEVATIDYTDGDNALTIADGGGVTFAQNTTFSGIVDITDATDSSDATGDTGALRTEGGASIAKKLYVGTDLDVDGTAELDNITIGGAQGSDGQVLTSTGSAVAWEDAASGGGITHASTWLMTGDYDPASDGVITANLSEVTAAEGRWGQIGSSMTESSGIFTFPATGTWMVSWGISVYGSGSDTAMHFTMQTTDTGDFSSDSNDTGRILLAKSANEETSGYASLIMDVDDVSTDKIRFHQGYIAANITIAGAVNNNTWFEFIRLGDSST